MHAIPNALHPIIMNQGARFDYMVKGELEIAIVLGIPTVGPLILSSVYNKDMYVVSAIFMLVAVLLIVGNLSQTSCLPCWIPEYVMPPWSQLHECYKL